MFKPLEVMGPEHELAIVDDELKPLPISDKVIKAYSGKVQNFVELPRFTFGKEMQMHVMELKANQPFASPVLFEETMQGAVQTLSDFLRSKFGACLLGTGMHPLLKLNETGVWGHRHRSIYEAYGKVFNLRQHGWLNIQSFHLNLPYRREADAVLQLNLLANLVPYLPAVAASSPIYEGALREDVDNRLSFYKSNQQEVPSVAGDVVPDYVASFEAYCREVIGKYTRDLSVAGAEKVLLGREWVNSRGVIFRFDRKALEIRVIDEQECVKSDVALACFVCALMRGWLSEREPRFLPHELLVADFQTVIADGLNANVRHPYGPTARHVCRKLYDEAWANATNDEKLYLRLVQQRIRDGSLSDKIRQTINKKTQRMDFYDAVLDIYSKLINCLVTNQPYT